MRIDKKNVSKDKADEADYSLMSGIHTKTTTEMEAAYFSSVFRKLLYRETELF